VEGICAARTLARVITGANDRAKQQQGESATSAISCSNGRRTSAVVHVMLAILSEEVVIPKVTVIGIAEDIPESLLARIRVLTSNPSWTARTRREIGRGSPRQNLRSLWRS
jgi:hypothetical protein